ncbi:hypothetical protein AVANS14531_07100 [Campylobacter sp. Cr9]|uniref:RAMP superfamily CRISPR-associated protein n=1 Tax=Campylobacter sp. Cr9 TaxID=2735728 RepID=UPI003014C5EB|nr:hypothetical protein [Campylobacter sp. Cr9]
MSQEVHKKLRKKIFYKGILENLSAFSIGSKEGDFIDSLCLKDKDDKPYISATSLAGVLKAKLKNNPLLGDNDNKSLVILSDCECEEKPKMGIRNSVAINSENGIAKNGVLFDYEVVFKGAEFNFECLINIYEDDFANEIEEFEKAINSELLVGMKTMSGFGEFAMKKLFKTEFDFSKNDEFKRYEKFLKEPFYENAVEFKQDKKDFEIKLELDITNSLLIGSVNNDDEKADIASLCEDGKSIASGTSFKGAIRHQALRIANTFDTKLSKEFVNELFGYVDGNTAKKSRVRINESEIDSVLPPKLHQRNKIDRFSGATIDGALFDAKAIYGGKINLTIEVLSQKLEDEKNENLTDEEKEQIKARNEEKLKRYEKEKALMLFVARDLCAGFLAVGGGKNVGRGVFKGEKENFKVRENNKPLEIEDIEKIAKELLK